MKCKTDNNICHHVEALFAYKFDWNKPKDHGGNNWCSLGLCYALM